MTEEDKKLLLTDLSARLTYGVKYMMGSWNYDTDQELSVIETLECVDKDGYINHRQIYEVDDIKPYLFPLSSMTDEQDKEFALLQTSAGQEGFIYIWNCANMMKWLIENHFDYNGLIEKGLAIDATGKNIY